MHTVLITGCNRGLGLEWTEQLAEAGWRVYATCRRPESADALNLLAAGYAANLSVHRLDVTSEEQIAALAAELQGRPIDMLLNNAGAYFEKYLDEHLGNVDYGNWQETFRVNTLGPVRMSEAFADHLAMSELKRVVTISSHMGSISDIGSPGDYAYRSSKAALNAAMKGLSLELQPRGISVVLLHPGWVQTRMGGPDATLSTHESVQGMRRVLDDFRPELTGGFFRYDGSSIPW
jgi:NAD(P)-dependent dehydrogenase (short-subunit alcohol dehydrogenase family)